MAYRRQILSKAPVSGIVLKLTDVGELEFAEAPQTYWNLLQQNVTAEVLTLVAAVNNLLLLRPHDPAVHRQLEGWFLRLAHRAHIATPLDSNDPHPTFRLAFSRLANLLNLKLLISLLDKREARTNWASRLLKAVGRTAKRLCMIATPIRKRILANRQRALATTPKRVIPGDLAILANEFTGSSRIRDGDQPTPMDLILEFVPRWEIDNPPDVAYSWTRAAKMLFTYLPGNDAIVSRIRDSIPLDFGNLSYRGLPSNVFIAAAFGVYSEVKAMSPETLGNCVVDVRSLAESLRMRRDVLRRFLKAVAVPASSVARSIGAPTTFDEFRKCILSDAFVTDTVELRQHPIVDLRDGTFLVLDAQLVVELVSSQFYWHVFDSLGPRQRKQFRDLWGRLFELYLFDLLAHYYPAASGVLRTEVTFTRGQIDALLDFGDVVLVFEFKASLLLREARFSREPAIFESEMSRKFGHGLEQLANATRAILDGDVRTVTYPRRPMRVFPILVADEAALESLGVNAFVNDLFQPLVRSCGQRYAIRPITIMSVEEFEEVLPYVASGCLRWPVLLEERFTGDAVGMESVHQMIYFHQKHDNVPLLRNEFLLADFKRIWESTIAPLRTAN